MNQIAIVGDIHGDVRRLGLALADSRVAERRTIFVGDYINRGPASREVIQLLVETQQKYPHWVFLEGNHEAMLLGLRGGKVSADSFIRAGGAATVLSYTQPDMGSIDAMLASIPEPHWAFFCNLRLFWTSEDLIVAHAGVHQGSLASRSASLSRKEALFGTNEWLFGASCDEMPIKVVCGHYRQHNGKPFITERFACIDTGCGIGGPLTVLLLPEWQCIQF